MEHADAESASADVEVMADAELMARALEQPRWFAVVFDRHFVTIHRYLARRVGAGADDLAGEVFRIAFERRASFDLSFDSARPWLYGIATKLVHRDRRREERRLRAMQRVATRTRSDEDGFDLVDERIDAESAMQSVARAVGQLPDADRDALVLFAVEGLSYNDVATALDIPVGTVRSRISRARLRLRELLGGSGQREVVWPEAEGCRDG